MTEMTKQLAEYPLNQWIEAAGECPQCNSKQVQVMLTWLDKSGNLGDVTIKCLTCGFSDYDLAGWKVGSKAVTILGKQYTPLTSRANVGSCVVCDRIIVGVPLILFINEGRGGELDFCTECAEKTGVLGALLK